ncbi:class I SAM-dependent methyltransferase [Aureispira anguillae]|uniref:carnosine N-methyltransferase n=1 Tax=Aureispira anguillae TaxID=2864201 RepID=A0A915YIJ0_9BACT|nr:class I SAM-dependent methyltransferase [Aureispira anguillae]BDS13642.1 class I SAM-dependent methyltransferase [Aureispira anguillae]
MVFDNLTDDEKAYWLNYLVRMEGLHGQTVPQKEHLAIDNGISARRIALIEEANLFYKNIYTKIKDELYPLVAKETLLTKEVQSFSYESATPFSFGYLIRDWGHNSTYDQYGIIHSFLEEKLQAMNVSAAPSALFLGCGTGRYAVDLAYRYNQVDAFDASLFMIWSINHLKKVRTWEVVQKVLRNCRTIEDTIQRVTLKMTEEQVRTIDEKVNFFIAQASNIPLDQGAINHIYSIYFTDVLPLNVLFGELDRLLAANGLFIHFGPLEYFFNTELEMLSAEEVALFFQKKGYRILANEFLATRHLFNPNSMRYRMYDNWFFVAQKGDAQARLTLSDVLVVNNAVELRVTRRAKDGKCMEASYAASFHQKAYDLPEIIYELMLKIDGKTTLEQILWQLEISDIIEEEKEQLLAILQELLESNFIALK